MITANRFCHRSHQGLIRTAVTRIKGLTKIAARVASLVVFRVVARIASRVMIRVAPRVTAGVDQSQRESQHDEGSSAKTTVVPFCTSVTALTRFPQPQMPLPQATCREQQKHEAADDEKHEAAADEENLQDLVMRCMGRMGLEGYHAIPLSQAPYG